MGLYLIGFLYFALSAAESHLQETVLVHHLLINGVEVDDETWFACRYGYCVCAILV